MPRLLTRGDDPSPISATGWPASSRKGGRHQIGTLADFASEWVAGFRRNPHSATMMHRWFPGVAGTWATPSMSSYVTWRISTAVHGVVVPSMSRNPRRITAPSMDSTTPSGLKGV